MVSDFLAFALWLLACVLFAVLATKTEIPEPEPDTVDADTLRRLNMDEDARERFNHELARGWVRRRG